MLYDVDFSVPEQVEAACASLLDAIKTLDEALSLTQDRVDRLEADLARRIREERAQARR